MIWIERIQISQVVSSPWRGRRVRPVCLDAFLGFYSAGIETGFRGMYVITPSHTAINFYQQSDKSMVKISTTYTLL